MFEALPDAFRALPGGCFVIPAPVFTIRTAFQRSPSRFERSRTAIFLARRTFYRSGSPSDLPEWAFCASGPSSCVPAHPANAPAPPSWRMARHPVFLSRRGSDSGRRVAMKPAILLSVGPSDAPEASKGSRPRSISSKGSPTPGSADPRTAAGAGWPRSRSP
jgi:hypothetical protein